MSTFNPTIRLLNPSENTGADKVLTYNILTKEVEYMDAPAYLGTPSLDQVALIDNITTVILKGASFFANKDDNDFAQMKDLSDLEPSNIEMRFSDDIVQWRLEGDPTWNNLFALDEIASEFRVVNGIFEYRQMPNSPWVELTDFNDFVPSIGVNGNWWINGQDTGTSAQVMPTTAYDNDISGIRDGVNTDFESPEAFVPGSLSVYLDGSRLSKGNNMDYVELIESVPTPNGRGAIINRVITPQNKLIFEYVKI